jgi:cellobiose-specific phosphotransferase system component IIA
VTESQQHQEPIKHAEEHAESAIMAAQRAEAMLHDALTLADPQQIQSAQARIEQAQHDIVEARKHMVEFSVMEPYAQQLSSKSEDLHKASLDMEVATDKSKMPKQVR